MTKKKNTDELLDELKFKSENIGEYIKSNEGSLIENNLSEFWKRIIEKTGMSNIDIINRAEISYVYFYDIMNGKKIPSSDKIVRIALACAMELEDCQAALKYCGKAALYPRIKRDSVLIWAITHHLSVGEVNELLIKENESELK